jgi:photosystem II stability/assembly factor-like uncharacterized protein
MIFKNVLLFLVCVTTGLYAHGNLSIGKIRVVKPGVSLRGVCAVSDREAWVSGSHGSIYVTLNGGQTWRKSQVSDGHALDFRDIEVLTDGSVVVMSAGPGDKSRIYRSTDRGGTWHRVFVNPFKNGFLNTIVFWDDNRGLGVGDPIEGRFYIISTLDGGRTWRELKREKCPRAHPGEAGFAASGTCISVAGNGHAWIGTGGKTARVLMTSDLGKSWHISNTPILQGEPSAGIFSLFFNDEQHGIIVGGDYKKTTATVKTAAQTRDGGKTWHLIAPGRLPFLSAVKGVMIGGKLVYLATGPAGIFLSNSPQKWQRISTQGFHCLGVDRHGESAWLAGSAGRVTTIRIPR